MLSLQSLLGLILLNTLAWTISENRGAVRIKGVVVGMAIQTIFALALLKLPPIRNGTDMLVNGNTMEGGAYRGSVNGY